MATVTERGTPGVDNGDGLVTRIFLQPIAAPTVLGYFAGFCGFLLFGVWLTGNLGPPKNAIAMWPFITLFAGLGQLAAGLWSIRGRDGIGAGLFCSWGGFWIAYGLLWLIDSIGMVHIPAFASGFQPLGQWLMYMAVITCTCAVAALGRSPAQFVSQIVATAATGIAAWALMAAAPGWQHAAGWLYVAASAMFAYHAAACMINATVGRVLLPHLGWRGDENRFGAEPLRPLEYEHGDPGVRVGQ